MNENKMINKLKFERYALLPGISFLMILVIFTLIPLAQAAIPDTDYFNTIINTDGS